MRKNQGYSVFNNFNKNFHAGPYEPNYYDEYENEFSEELFNAYGLNRTNQLGRENRASWNQQRKFSSQPRNGESTVD